jgi:hypothetical protein
MAGRAVAPGVTTDEIDALVHEAIVQAGAYPSPLNYHGTYFSTLPTTQIELHILTLALFIHVSFTNRIPKKLLYKR